jgi:hypothetical protein
LGFLLAKPTVIGIEMKNSDGGNPWQLCGLFYGKSLNFEVSLTSGFFMQIKIKFFWLSLLLLPLLAFQCEEDRHLGVYKGKLAVAGICGNYTIVLLEGDLSPVLYENTWVDPQTNNSYTKAFRLANFCDFPTAIQEGQEFYFSLESSPSNQCVTCLAVYPTPAKAIAIRVR